MLTTVEAHANAEGEQMLRCCLRRTCEKKGVKASKGLRKPRLAWAQGKTAGCSGLETCCWILARSRFGTEVKIRDFKYYTLTLRSVKLTIRARTVIGSAFKPRMEVKAKQAWGQRVKGKGYQLFRTV